MPGSHLREPGIVVRGRSVGQICLFGDIHRPATTFRALLAAALELQDIGETDQEVPTVRQIVARDLAVVEQSRDEGT